MVNSLQLTFGSNPNGTPNEEELAAREAYFIVKALGGESPVAGKIGAEYLPPGDGTVTIHEFETDADKRLATGLVPGDIAIITGEGNRVEQYLGDVAGETDDMLLATFSGSDWVMVWTGFSWFHASDNLIYDDGGAWTISGPDQPISNTASDFPAHPADATWPGGVSVERMGGTANQDNWVVLKNSFRIEAYGEVAASNPGLFQVNGATLTTTPNYLGWCREDGYVNFQGDLTSSALMELSRFVTYDSNGNPVNGQFPYDGVATVANTLGFVSSYIILPSADGVNFHPYMVVPDRGTLQLVFKEA
jgi:hypothetical protein